MEKKIFIIAVALAISIFLFNITEAQIFVPVETVNGRANRCSTYHFHDRDDSIFRSGITDAWDTDGGFYPCRLGAIRKRSNDELIVKDECFSSTTLYEYTYEGTDIIQHSVHCNLGCHVGGNDIGFCG